jgi:hypothetical protein
MKIFIKNIEELQHVTEYRLTNPISPAPTIPTFDYHAKRELWRLQECKIWGNKLIPRHLVLCVGSNEHLTQKSRVYSITRILLKNIADYISILDNQNIYRQLIMCTPCKRRKGRILKLHETMLRINVEHK